MDSLRQILIDEWFDARSKFGDADDALDAWCFSYRDRIANASTVEEVIEIRQLFVGIPAYTSNAPRMMDVECIDRLEELDSSTWKPS